jgi:DNA polymerase I-like protein with 3'-5' exonuclease and polymerase domains
MSQNYIDYEFDFKDRFYDRVISFNGNPQLLKNKVKKPVGKILFVLDHLPKEDMKSGKILSGYTDDVFNSITGLATSFYKADYSLDQFDYLVVNFNCCMTYGMSPDWQQECKEEFARRINSIITQYKPDIVHTFGLDPFKALNQEKLVGCKNNTQNYLGVPIPTKIKFEGKTRKFKHVPSLSLNSLVDPAPGDTNTPNLLGYVTRNLVTTLDNGRLRYAIPFISDEKKKSFKIKYITTLKGVKKCLDLMAKADYVAVDTETESLYRVTNKIQTIQFCRDGKNAYIIPIYHKDTPFTSKELKTIGKLLRNYFEYDNKNIWQIYTNGKFDLNIVRGAFGVRYFKANIWDVQGGEFGMDENMKGLFTLTSKGYYNLGNLAMQYGCTSYYTIKFGKEARKTISQVDLNEDVQEYCALDVIIPWHIMFSQWQRAKDIDYKLYKDLVGLQISDQIQSFSCLESTGAYTDVEYLFKLQHPNSVINQEIEKLEAIIYTSKPVKQANKILAGLNNVPEYGLWGKIEDKNRFSLGTEEHKQMLFFDILDLEPIESSTKKFRPNGKPLGKINKEFQKAYEETEPLVKAFSALQKAYKLRNAYVKSLIKLWAADDDFKFDQRIRPNYGYLGVVTGRTSASDPNLQQIPSRSALGKHIKRLFSSRKGKLLIKVDYSAHEVRGWSIISGDQGVADQFSQGAKLRKRFRLVPDPLIADRIEDEGDVHRMNASYFFGIPITMKAKIKEVRDSVKAVIFGLIYQQGDKGLAKNTGRDISEIKSLKTRFLERFPVGLKWFDKIKSFAWKNLFVESPLGRRRHLWALMFPRTHPQYGYITSTQERRSVNSPVQGFGSDIMMIGIRNLNRLMYEHFEKTSHYPDMHLSVSVHDSLTVETGYDDIWLALDLIEKALTSEAVKVIKERYDFDFISNPEIDFDIGATEKHVKGWDFSYESMGKLIHTTLTDQKDELGYDIDVEKEYKKIMEDQYKTLPDWMKKQVWATKVPMESKGKDIRNKKELKNSKIFMKELPGNIKLMDQRALDLLEGNDSTISENKKSSIKKAIKQARIKRKALREFKKGKTSV